jgi:hypothetical protein
VIPLSNVVFCPVCKRAKGKETPMTRKHDTLECSECKTVFVLEGESPLERYIECWKSSAEELFPLLRPELTIMKLPVPGLYFLYEDCYHALLIGRYNASIVLMGLLLEALMKERIRLKTGEDLHGPFEQCLQEIRKRGLMEPRDIYFLRKFKEEVRNPYAHFDESEIVDGMVVPVWEIPTAELAPEKFVKVLNDIKSGRLKPRLLQATHPALRSIVKHTYDSKSAIILFNQVYDFLVSAQIKYLKQADYDEYNRKFGSPMA